MFSKRHAAGAGTGTVASARPARRWVAVLAAASVLLGACTASQDGAATNTTTKTAGQGTEAGTSSPEPTADGVLRIGLLYPASGSQAAQGPAILAAAELAVAQLNDNGGVLGQPVELLARDAGDATTDVASASLDQLSAAKVDVIIAPPSSGVTTLVLDKVARSGALLIATANAPNDPPAAAAVPYVQLAPTLELLGRAVGERVAAAGNATTLIVARDDPFGQRVSTAAAAAMREDRVDTVLQRYNPESEVYTTDIAAAVAAKPARVVLVGYAEVAEFLGGLIAAGLTPATVPTFVVSDRVDDGLFRRFTQPGALSGLSVIGLGTAVAGRQSGFAAEVAPGSSSPAGALFAAETYDAVTLAALAAAKGGSDGPRALHGAVASVSGGQGGDACADPAACMAVLAGGRDTLTYRGKAGPYRLDSSNLAGAVTFAEFPLGADNKLAMGQADVFRVGDG